MTPYSRGWGRTRFPAHNLPTEWIDKRGGIRG